MSTPYSTPLTQVCVRQYNKRYVVPSLHVVSSCNNGCLAAELAYTALLLLVEIRPALPIVPSSVTRPWTPFARGDDPEQLLYSGSLRIAKLSNCDPL